MDVVVTPMTNTTVYPDPPSSSPSLIAPEGIIDEASPTYKWSAVDTATRYHLTIINGVHSMDQWYPADQIGCSTSDTCEVTPDFPVSGATNWFVLPANNAGEGSSSQDASFIVSDGSVLPGDSNSDGTINVLDVIGLINVVFNEGAETIGSDCNGDESVNVLDVICIINKVFNN